MVSDSQVYQRFKSETICLIRFMKRLVKRFVRKKGENRAFSTGWARFTFETFHETIAVSFHTPPL
jgi:hypothetical protein